MPPTWETRPPRACCRTAGRRLPGSSVSPIISATAPGIENRRQPHNISSRRQGGATPPAAAGKAAGQSTPAGRIARRRHKRQQNDAAPEQPPAKLRAARSRRRICAAPGQPPAGRRDPVRSCRQDACASPRSAGRANPPLFARPKQHTLRTGKTNALPHFVERKDALRESKIQRFGRCASPQTVQSCRTGRAARMRRAPCEPLRKEGMAYGFVFA